MGSNEGLKEVHTVTQYFALCVAADERWLMQNDTFGVSIVGFILFGFAVKYSRIFGFDPQIGADALADVMQDVFSCSPKWTTGFIGEAKKSAFDLSYHKGQFDLIAVGSGYEVAEEMDNEVDNVYANVVAYRKEKQKGDVPR